MGNSSLIYHKIMKHGRIYWSCIKKECKVGDIDFDYKKPIYCPECGKEMTKKCIEELEHYRTTKYYDSNRRSDGSLVTQNEELYIIPYETTYECPNCKSKMEFKANCIERQRYSEDID